MRDGEAKNDIHTEAPDEPSGAARGTKSVVEKRMMFVAVGLRERLTPLKVRPPGTPCFEAQAGTQAAIEHIAWLGEQCAGVDAAPPLDRRIVTGLEAATAYEAGLMDRFLAGTTAIPGLTLSASPAATDWTRACRPLASGWPIARRWKTRLRWLRKNIFGWAGDSMP